MQLTVHRIWFSPQSTQGSLDIDGIFFCYTLEPRKDQTFGKPFCIPLGMYPIRLLWSNHFQRITPHVMNVPGFEEVEIHMGNFPEDTEACLLVGKSRSPDFVGQSDLTFAALMARLSGQKEISITYQEETEES